MKETGEKPFSSEEGEPAKVPRPLRILVGTESLNGLILITWSASFTYLSMEKFWQDHR